jgi:hypothetical protein
VTATVGALLTGLGGVGYGAGFFAYGALGWYATSPALPAPAGSALLAYADDNALHVFGPQIAGFLLAALGCQLLAVALWRSHATPRWLPVAVPVTFLLAILAGTGIAFDVVNALFMATFLRWPLSSGGADQRRSEVTAPVHADAEWRDLVRPLCWGAVVLLVVAWLAGVADWLWRADQVPVIDFYPWTSAEGREVLAGWGVTERGWAGSWSCSRPSLSWRGSSRRAWSCTGRRRGSGCTSASCWSCSRPPAGTSPSSPDSSTPS